MYFDKKKLDSDKSKTTTRRSNYLTQNSKMKKATSLEKGEIKTNRVPPIVSMSKIINEIDLGAVKVEEEQSNKDSGSKLSLENSFSQTELVSRLGTNNISEVKGILSSNEISSEDRISSNSKVFLQSEDLISTTVKVTPSRICEFWESVNSAIKNVSNENIIIALMFLFPLFGCMAASYFYQFYGARMNQQTFCEHVINILKSYFK